MSPGSGLPCERAQPTTGPSSTVCDSGREPLYSYGRRRSYWPTWRATGVPTARRCADEKTRSSYPKPSSSPGPGLNPPLSRTQARAKTHRPVLHALRQARSPNPNPSPSPSPNPKPSPKPKPKPYPDPRAGCAEARRAAWAAVAQHRGAPSARAWGGHGPASVGGALPGAAHRLHAGSSRSAPPIAAHGAARSPSS